MRLADVVSSKATRRAEYRALHADGTAIWVESVARPILDADGRTVEVQASTRDVSDRHRAEEAAAAARDALEEANATLERRVAERTIELSKAVSDLESFSYTVSHDLRAPLRAIDGFAAIVVEEHSASLPPEGRALLERVSAGTRRMAQVIDDLLALARSSRVALRRVPVDLTDLSRGVAQDLARANAGRAVTFDVDEGLVCHADAGLVRTVIENLLANAWKFTARTTDARVEVRSEMRDGEQWFVVRDNGAGFDPKHAHKLFGTFERLHSSRDYPGTGIGLALVRRIVERHGGHVSARGNVGAGAAFAFTLSPRA
jgi:signal transduction histidine kinase